MRRKVISPSLSPSSAAPAPAPAGAQGSGCSLATAKPSGGCTHLRVRQLDRLLSRHYDGHFVGCALTAGQYALLTHLQASGPVLLGELARCLRMDASTITRNLQPLLAAGWLEPLPGDDARSRRVGITETGRQQRAEAAGRWAEAQRALNERLGAEQVAELHQVLERCLTALDPGSGGPLDPEEAEAAGPAG